MKVLTASALAAMFVVGGIFVSQRVDAQNNQPCAGENCPAPGMDNQGPITKKYRGTDQNNQMQDAGGQGDQMLPRRKRTQGTGSNNNDVHVDMDVQVGSQQRAHHVDWRFDPGKHQRRRSKSTTFRFYFDGYWYPQAYWEVYSIRPRRVSCGEGRGIVSERFNRVRVVECRGGTYTYLGRRQGDTYRILLNARTGRIVGRALI